MAHMAAVCNIFGVSLQLYLQFLYWCLFDCSVHAGRSEAETTKPDLCSFGLHRQGWLCGKIALCPMAAMYSIGMGHVGPIGITVNLVRLT